MLRLIGKFFLWLFAFLGACVFLMIIGIAIVGFSWERQSKIELPQHMILQFDLADGFVESESQTTIWQKFLKNENLPLRPALDAIRAAATDADVDAIVMRVDTHNLGPAQAGELRDAILDFRASGKKAYAFADTFGLEGTGSSSYYIASAFDEIWMQPSGDWGFAGISLEVPFVRGFLDKIGVKPAFGAREEYKDAMNFLSEKSFTAPEREALTSLGESLLNQRLQAISDARGIDLATLRGYMNEAPLFSGRALSYDLIDSLGYWPQLRDLIMKHSRKDAEWVHLADYATTIYPEKGAEIAVIYGVGEVMRGHEEGAGRFGARNHFYADDTVAALREAEKDSHIKAILLRIDSPGGSYVASDTIWQAVMEARAKKPVIALMGNVAASGGYFAAAAANRIVAAPSTITGSVGVIAGKIVADELLDKLGVNVGRIQIGDNADMWSPTHDFTPAGRKKLEEFLDHIYFDFLQKVAYSRHMPLDQVRAAAKGRAWTGEQALKTGLIDTLGGWEEAKDELRMALNLAEGAPLNFEVFPQHKASFQDLFGLMTEFSAESKFDFGPLQKVMAVVESYSAASRGEAQFISPTIVVK
jgi:protease-4